MPLSLTNYNKNISDIVREDYRTADVLRQYGINYCCGGKVLLEEACLQRNINFSDLIAKLDEATRVINLPNNLQFNNWKIDFLIDYLINIHHAYMTEALPALEVSLLSFVGSHKKQYPHFETILENFQELYSLLVNENRYEEETIFPYIKQIDNAYRRKETYGKLFVRTLGKPLNMIDRDRQKISEILNGIRSLTDNYHFPDTACTNHQVIFHKLREFDSDLVQHKHLENNILFPKAIEMEQQLLQS